MSGTHKYSTARISEQRREQARREVEAERQRRAAEAARRLTQLVAEREQGMARAIAIVNARREAAQALLHSQAASQATAEVGDQRAEALDRHRRAAASPGPGRVATHTSQSPAAAPAVTPAAAAPTFAAAGLAPPVAAAAGTPTSAATDAGAPGPAPEWVPRRLTALPAAGKESVVPIEPVHAPYPRPVPAAGDRQTEAAVAAGLIAQGLGLRADAGALLASWAAPMPGTTQAAARDRLLTADQSLASALESTSGAAVAAAVDAATAALVAGQAEYEDQVELQARRRIIATSIVTALPDRYVVSGGLTEDPDGTIRFAAAAPDEELWVTVTGTAETGDVIGYQADGAHVETRVEDGRVVADCPGLAARLEELHERLGPLGVTAGPLTWRDAPGRRRRPDAGSQTKRRTR